MDARAAGGPRALPRLLAAAVSAGVEVTAARVHRPTLDDVFLSSTGRSVRGAPASDDTTTTTQEVAE